MSRQREAKATFIDEPETEHLRTGRRQLYVRIAAVVALTVGILVAGYFGPHPASTPSASASPSARPLLAARVSRSPEPGASPGLNEPEAALGLKLVRNVTRRTASVLPLQITRFAPRPVGNRLFFVVHSQVVESSALGTNADPAVLATVEGCQSINQIAAVAGALMYLVTWPEQPKPAGGGCDSFTGTDWSLRLTDLGTGASREVAHGSRPKTRADVDGFPIHFALTPTGYAFDRPIGDTAAGETIEVHSLAGRLLWATRTYSHVVQLDMGGDLLAAVTQPSWPEGGLSYSVASTSRPKLEPVSEPASSVSLSPDGLFAVWDVVLRGVGFGWNSVAADIDLARTQVGVSSVLPPAASDQLIPSNPVVTSTPRGPFVAWLVTGPGAIVYPAFTLPDRGVSGFLESVQAPIWIGVTGSTLIWVAESADGWSYVAYSIDLASLENA